MPEPTEEIERDFVTEAAMCLWEDVIRRIKEEPETSPLQVARMDGGTANLRLEVLQLAEPCAQAWAVAEALGYQEAFDWEFCPWFLDACVGMEGGPTLRPNWQDLVSAMASEQVG